MALVKQQIREINPFCEKNKELNRSTSRKRTAYAQSETDFILRRRFIYWKCSSTKAAIKNKAHKNRKCKPRIQQHMEGTRGQQDKSKQLISDLGGKRSCYKGQSHNYQFQFLLLMNR